MKRNYKLIGSLIFTGLMSMGGLAQARGCDGMGPMGGSEGPTAQRSGMRADPAQMAERHLGQLKSELKITAEQESLWQAFADKMKAEAGKGMQGMRSQVSDEKLSAPDRMAKRQAAMEEHLASMKAVHETFSRLYAALTPEQKLVADRLADRTGRGGGVQQKPQQKPQG